MSSVICAIYDEEDGVSIHFSAYTKYSTWHKMVKKQYTSIILFVTVLLGL